MVFGYNSNDGRVYSLANPEKPALPSVASAAIADKVIHALTGTTGVDVSATTGWTVTSGGTGFTPADFENGPLGAGVLHIDTNTVAIGDRATYDLGVGNEVTLSPDDEILLEVYSGPNENLTGTFLELIFAKTDVTAPDVVIPITVNAAGAKESKAYPLKGYAASDLEDLRYFGFRAAKASEFVVWLKDLRVSSGLTDEVAYKIRDVTIQGFSSIAGTELVLTGPEAPGPDDDDLTVDTGESGAQVTITRASVPSGVAQWEIYRRDAAAGLYHKVGTWPEHDRYQPLTAYEVGDIVRPPTLGEGRGSAGDAANQYYFTCTTAGTSAGRDETFLLTWPVDGTAMATGTAEFAVADLSHKQNVLAYVDATVDISANETLVEGRVPVPSPATAIGLYDNRLVLAVGVPNRTEISQHTGNLWVSGQDRSEWMAWGPEDWPALEAAGRINAASACRMPLGEIGRVMAMDPLGVWTGAAYTGPLMVGGQGGWTVALQGHGPTLSDGGYSLGFRLPLGCCGPEATTRDANGDAYFVTPAGDLMRLDREMNPAYLSQALEDVLRDGEDGWRAYWALGYDARYRRLVLATESRIFTLDLATGTWDEMSASVWGRPYVFGERPGPGGHLVMVKWEDA